MPLSLERWIRQVFETPSTFPPATGFAAVPRAPTDLVRAKRPAADEGSAAVAATEPAARRNFASAAFPVRPYAEFTGVVSSRQAQAAAAWCEKPRFRSLMFMATQKIVFVVRMIVADPDTGVGIQSRFNSKFF